MHDKDAGGLSWLNAANNCACAQTGYNLVYWLWKYSFDADCDLFLKILKGDVREDVYTAQRDLQVCLAGGRRGHLPGLISADQGTCNAWCNQLCSALDAAALPVLTTCQGRVGASGCCIAHPMAAHQSLARKLWVTR